MTDHEHEWKVIVKIAEGESYDAYYECRCNAIRHVYEFPPSGIQHVTMIADGAMSWTRGHAYGLLFGSEPSKRRVEPPLPKPLDIGLTFHAEDTEDDLEAALDLVYRTYHAAKR